MISETWLRETDSLVLAKAATLGLVEGATEFIPISSTGHLILVQDWLDLTGTKHDAFLIFIQLGAILAVVWLYRRKFAQIALNLLQDHKSQRLVANLIVATIPAAVIGLPTKDWVRVHFFDPVPVGWALVLGGVAILVIERLRLWPTVESVDDVPLRKALGIGLFQVLAILFPGVSRSAATIMGGLALGLSRTAAAEFSFFLAVPAMLGASVIELADIRHQLTPSDAPLFGVGFVVSFVSALIVIRVLLAFVSRHSFAPFAWYRIVFGAIVLTVYAQDLDGA